VYTLFMILTPKLQKAINRASSIHRSQSRRDRESTPYISHLFSVAALIDEFGGDENTVIAGLFHDSLEDVHGYEYADLISDVGEDSAAIVLALTEPALPLGDYSVEEYWRAKKEAYLKQIAGASSSAQLVAACDKIQNMSSMISGFEEEGEDFLRRFISHALKNQLWFYEEVYKTIENCLEEPVLVLYKKTLEEFRGYALR